MPYPKGSEWRRWDLQVQTYLDPAWSWPTGYPVGLQEKIEKFHEDLIKHCVDAGISVIAITDHNTGKAIDPLLKRNSELGSQISILPGVEVISSEGIHLIAIFNPDSSENRWTTWGETVDHFLTAINMPQPAFNGSGNNTPATANCTAENIILKIKEYDGVALFPHCHSSGGGVFQKSDARTRQRLFPIANILDAAAEVANLANRIAEINTKLSGYGLDPKNFAIINTSDSRRIADVGLKFSWIKADPTFQGLKQISYEPQGRVCIQEDKPEEKKPYFVIDKVRFIDNAGRNFAGDFIEINQNLNAIVGGKSTGKSLLLHYIAKTIDREEVKKRDAETKYDFEADTQFDFEVVWKDGGAMQLKSPEAESSDKKRKILYIPQNYLNKLSEENIQSKERLNEFVLNVLLQIKEVAARYDSFLAQIGTTNRKIPSSINELFALGSEMLEIQESIKKIGDRKGIETYIDQLKKEIENIKAQSTLSEVELKEYENLSVEEKKTSALVAGLEEDKKTLTNLQGVLIARADEIIGAKNEYRGYINNPDIKEKFDQNFKSVAALKPDIVTSITTLARFADEKIVENKIALDKITEKLKPILSKVKFQSELEKKNFALKQEEERINKIDLAAKNLKAKTEIYKQKITSINQLYKSIYDSYFSLAGDLKQYEKKFGDITLNITVGFKEDDFNSEVINEFFNKLDLKAIAKTEWKEEFEYKYDPQSHIQFVTSIPIGLLGGKVRTIKNRTKKDALTKLFEDRFYLDFKITYKNDALEKMSPGKKGLVLLRLLIELSNEEWPILLDQPEDDLDNRSVYNDLVAFFKGKKTERQILIVTHNPNLVVGADAEEVVVANQDQQEVGRDNRKFKFEYVSGSLESSFELEEETEKAILYRKGIREHVCEVLEGGKEAFQKREQKYDFS